MSDGKYGASFVRRSKELRTILRRKVTPPPSVCAQFPCAHLLHRGRKRSLTPASATQPMTGPVLLHCGNRNAAHSRISLPEGVATLSPPTWSPNRRHPG